MLTNFKNTIFPLILGNVLEWYDFVLFSYFINVFAHLYFPYHDNFASLILTYGLFATSYIMRPFGAILFGYIGDTMGRKVSLFSTMMIMSGCSFLISILPTYQLFGNYAGFLFIIIRMFQGLALGGEYSGVAIYLIENSPAKQKTFYGSFALAGAYLGFAVSASVALLFGVIFSPDALNSYGWRFAFAIGSLIGLIGFYVRFRLSEPKEFQKEILEKHIRVNPLKELYINNWQNLLKVFMIAIFPAGFSYMILVYFVELIKTNYHFSLEKISGINMLITVLGVLIIPMIGYLADKFTARRIFMWFAAITTALFCIPLMQLLIVHPILVLVICICLNMMFEANLAAEIVTYFPTSCHLSGLAIILNSANGLAGGLAPLIALLLVRETNTFISPMYYIISLCCVSMIGLLITRKMKNLH